MKGSLGEGVKVGKNKAGKRPTTAKEKRFKRYFSLNRKFSWRLGGGTIITLLFPTLKGSLTWKENRDRVVCIRAEIIFINGIFSNFSYKIPFHHCPGQIEGIQYKFRTILWACQSFHFIFRNWSENRNRIFVGWLQWFHYKLLPKYIQICNFSLILIPKARSPTFTKSQLPWISIFFPLSGWIFVKDYLEVNSV